MQCSKCQTIYYYDEETEYYNKPLSRQIEEKSCPQCKNELSETLQKYSPQKKCNNCGGNLRKEGTKKHEYREFFDLYSDVIDQ